ncbi:hypothetical protein A2899_00720 [Candidatus Amesbacteria bacterium RIFCSPLOWO2_01_FULL_49_25]|uniref:NAD(P)-binding domain-containing protein n=1 Tax=Candidatus Amesbacteria bacterium RIFCSPHIGHO2_01_FULL_48_32b TaxID=1797253 RepID=A0A1F4YCU2_9BACT|nr:MAG: hypothetical protein A2876_01525 [Candidatus Amesbacteria bacterium RIFCSPHIGHO2_01_FULL_48_32b]OGD08056.1 MAG: hypothetical protein A2899_00720 [Candidatus Amesbacteria bacterium RIFCSPLOWO2_01_FULL_49_25]
MKISVFGATGRTGRMVVEQALSQGIEVVGLVRDVGKMTMDDPKLQIVQGDVLDETAVERTVDEADGVVVALGPKPGGEDNVMAVGTGYVISAMRKHGVRRLVVQSSYAMSGSEAGVKFLEGMEEETMKMLKPAIDDKMNQERMVRESGLEWTIVRPLTLTDGPRLGKYRVGEDMEIAKTDTISRADVADLMLKLVGGSEWVGKTVTVTG